MNFYIQQKIPIELTAYLYIKMSSYRIKLNVYRRKNGSFLQEARCKRCFTVYKLQTIRQNSIDSVHFIVSLFWISVAFSFRFRFIVGVSMQKKCIYFEIYWIAKSCVSCCKNWQLKKHLQLVHLPVPHEKNQLSLPACCFACTFKRP